MLACISLETPLAFNNLGGAPITHLNTPENFLAGDQLRSCPLLLCDNEDFSFAAQYVDPDIRTGVVSILEAANRLFHDLFSTEVTTVGSHSLNLDALADVTAAATKASGLFLQTCALATRITSRTLTGEADAFDDPFNQFDVQTMYHNVRFMGLKAWVGLPYVYVWV